MFQREWFLLIVLCIRCSKADGLLRVSMGSALRSGSSLSFTLSTVLPLALSLVGCVSRQVARSARSRLLCEMKGFVAHQVRASSYVFFFVFCLFVSKLYVCVFCASLTPSFSQYCPWSRRVHPISPLPFVHLRYAFLPPFIRTAWHSAGRRLFFFRRTL